MYLFPSHRLGDDGGQTICRALFKNNTLTQVHLGSNDLGEPTAAILSQVLKTIMLSFRNNCAGADLPRFLGIPTLLKHHKMCIA